MTDQAGARSFAPPPLPTFEAMIDTIAKPIPAFVALVAGAAATVAVAVALHGSASSQPEPTQAERAAAAPLVAPLPSPAESTRSQIDRFTAALAAAPRDPSAYDNLAFAELQMAREDGDPTWYTKANRLLERAVELAPRDAAALAGLGSLAMSRHDFAGADRLGRRALGARSRQRFRVRRDRRRQRRAGPLRRGPKGARADARDQAQPLVLRPRLVPARAARPRCRRPEGDGRGRPLRCPGP